MHRLCYLLLSIALFFSSNLSAQETRTFYLDLPFYHSPFNNLPGHPYPSFRQSLDYSRDTYQLVHRQIVDSLSDGGNEKWIPLSLVLFDVGTYFLPLSYAWLHEEWHRAVLSRRGIDSYNDIYKLEASQTIAVSHVSDEDLIALKRDHPSEMVYLHSAGLISQYQQNIELEKSAFFFYTDYQDIPLLWINHTNNHGYINACSSNEGNRLTAEILAGEDSDIGPRDFTGLDCVAWVYDLFRPDEPYEQRGQHPSGTGLLRYRTLADLNTEERDFLRKQFYLAFVNYFNPHLWGFHRFRINNPYNDKPMYWNLAAGHVLAPFGYSLDGRFYFQQDSTNLAATLHLYQTHHHRYTGLDLELIRHPGLKNWGIDQLSARLALWTQPQGMLFDATQAQAGQALQLQLFKNLSKQWQTYISVQGKSAGWLSDNVNLDSGYDILFGASATLN